MSDNIPDLYNIYNAYDDENVEFDGSIKITSIEEAIEDTGLKILVYGVSGAGKTCLAATTGKPTLIISSEAGLLSLKGAPDYYQTTKISYTKQLNTIYHHLALAKKKQYDWIVIDSISEIAETILENEMKHLKDGRQYWWTMAEKVKIIIKGFRDLAGYNVLFTAKQDRFVDKNTNRTYYCPSVPGQSLQQDLPHLFDEIFNLRVDTNQNSDEFRILQTGLDIQYLAKDRSGKLEIFEEASIKQIEMKIRGDDYVKYIKPDQQQKIENETQAN